MRIGWLLASFLLLMGRADAVYYGQTKAALIEELGKPISVLAKDEREVLLYKAGRIELQAGKVVFVQGIEVREGAEPAAVAAQASTESAIPAAANRMPPATTPPTGAAQAMPVTPTALPANQAGTPVPPRLEMDKAIEQLEAQQGQRPEVTRPRFNFFNFAVELALSWVLMLAALKLTCKYWAVEIAWPGLLLAALADAGVRAVVNLVVKLALQMPSAFYADEAIAACVLVMVLKKVSFNQSTTQAIQVTMTAKVFSVVVGSFLLTVLMHALG